MTKKITINTKTPYISEIRGSNILFTGAMGVGKSEAQISFLKRFSSYSRYRVLAFTHTMDEKSGDGRIWTRAGDSFPASKVSNANEIYEIVKEKDREGFVDIVVIDEVLFWGTELIPVLYKLNHEGRVCVLSALSYNFRFERIPVVEFIAGWNNTGRDELSALCQVSKGGKPCSRPADVSYLLYLAENGIKICYDNKGVDALWTPAHYWTQTVQMQPTHDPHKIRPGEPYYVASCDNCFKIPGKDETFTVLNKIKNANERGLSKSELIQYDIPYLEEILRFLSDPQENRSVRKYEDKYVYSGPMDF